MESALVPVGIGALIFGGCCSNVFALEAIIKKQPDSGLLVTLTQFMFITLSGLPYQFDPNEPYLLKKRGVPLRKWAWSAAMFFAINMLNNWAFAFQISVPVHIILRSFGSVTTMIAGWMRGKRYSRIQVLSVVLLTIGVLVAAWADASSKGKPMSTNNINFTDPSFEAGLLILLIAQLLSAYMGAYVEDIYAEHGNYWHENLFYSHFLSLPLFLPLQPTLQRQYVRLAASPPLAQNALALSVLPSTKHSYFGQLPEAVFSLLANAALQLLCISGVNLLSAKSSAVTVTIVLNIRKLVSFILSIVLFGNKMSAQMIVGAAMVFGAGTLYGLETTYWMPARKKNAAKEKGKKAK